MDSCSSCTDTKCAAPLRLVSATVGSGGSPTGGCESTARPTTWDVLSLPKNGKTVMELAQPDSPIGIVEATFGTDSPLIKDALVKSWTDKPVHSYMLGRVDLYSDGTARIATDSAVVVRSDLSPQQIVETGPRDFGATALQNVRIRLMGFFVAEVTYADGSTWHENTSALLRNTTRGRWSLVAEGAN